MALILARSPYLIGRQGFDNNAILTLELYIRIPTGAFLSLKTYTLNFRLQTSLDIAPFIRDYLTNNKILLVKVTINGNIGGVAQSPVVIEHFATDGYSYFEEGYNNDVSSELEANSHYAGSNTLLQFNKNAFLRIPFLYAEEEGAAGAITSIAINVYDSSNNILQTLNTGSFTAPIITQNRIQYIFIGYGDYEQYFKNRVLKEFGIFESSNCLVTFIDGLNFTSNVTRIEIVGRSSRGAIVNTKTLSVETIEECKYEPKEVHFVNRYGVEETFWFFKKNVKSITVEKETYRPNIAGSYASGILSHQYQDYNVNGREKIVLNTGFVNESFSENIKQLMLSEKVWVYNNGIKRPVNVATSEMELRTHVNDKLINYTMEFEFSNEIINNVG
jgi:uncharacterized membrane protein